ncbi:hypothetical protein Kfla_2684 [Kribbella flavida DSM 17836]|uniref:Uncharacterized protein n=1 Tax=Kribbella flavida (strain DSM 17836 / JCM 10339 / NBRC 14399) TaxID=479435 RepID=D2PYV6_KRIFD|nr:hypothetical protein Kfla_2684 [Kribbella flavida DSM 17836]
MSGGMKVGDVLAAERRKLHSGRLAGWGSDTSVAVEGGNTRP